MLILSSSLHPQVRQFFHRIGKLSEPHRQAYITLIEGLVSSGLWSKFDRLYVFATDSELSARANLTPNYPVALSGTSPVFSVNMGFGSAVQGTQLNFQLETEFIPSTAVLPQFTLDSAHMAAWVTGFNPSNFGVNVTGMCGAWDGASAYIEIAYRSSNIYYVLNSNASAIFPGNAGSGFHLASRTGPTTMTAYRNATVVASDSAPTTVLANREIWILERNNPTRTGAYPAVVGHFSIGAGLSGAEITNYHGLLRDYLVAVRGTVSDIGG